MNFTEALDEVIGITKRPDKTSQIASNINKAIAFWTFKADFSRDLLEEEIPVDSTLYGDTIDLSLLAAPLTRFRKMKYLKPRGERYLIKPIDPLDLLTPSGQVQPNRYYIAGNNLTYTFSKLNSILDIGYYSYAPILSGLDTYWMLDLMPWAVTERAASQTFKAIGDDASAAFYERSSMEFFLAGRRDFADQTSDEAS